MIKKFTLSQCHDLYVHPCELGNQCERCTNQIKLSINFNILWPVVYIATVFNISRFSIWHKPPISYLVETCSLTIFGWKTAKSSKTIDPWDTSLTWKTFSIAINKLEQSSDKISTFAVIWIRLKSRKFFSTLMYVAFKCCTTYMYLH